MISYDYWQRRFGLTSDIAGRSVTLSGVKYTILGVTQKGFTGEWVGRPADVWIPISMLAQGLTELPPGTYPRGGRLSYIVFARLRPGVTMEDAQAAGQVVYQQLLLEERAGPSPSAELLQRIRNARFEVERGALGYSPQRESYRQPLGILAFMVGLVLLIACANTANLLLARSAARQKEMAVRLAVQAAAGSCGNCSRRAFSSRCWVLRLVCCLRSGELLL